MTGLLAVCGMDKSTSPETIGTRWSGVAIRCGMASPVIEGMEK